MWQCERVNFRRVYACTVDAGRPGCGSERVNCRHGTCPRTLRGVFLETVDSERDGGAEREYVLLPLERQGEARSSVVTCGHLLDR